MNERVLVGMSGGIDSSVAALLVRDQGYDVTGVIMKIWDDSYSVELSGSHACFGPDEKEDVEKAREVCDLLGIPLVEIDLKDEYRTTVLDYFVSEYSCGRTPNPCIRCNSRMKFDRMFKKAAEQGIEYEYVATGHYVRSEFDPEFGAHVLKQAVDTRKDQSYFLSRLDRDLLPRTLFPLGSMKKEQVRRLSVERCLGFEQIPESQDFIAGDYTLLLPEGKPGYIKDSEGRILGHHEGIERFTIGQRRGLGISSHSPLYVTAIDAPTQTVFVGDEMGLYSKDLRAHEVHLLIPDEFELSFPLQCTAKIRSSGQPAPATVIREEQGDWLVSFDEPRRAVAPGQSIVFYLGQTMIAAATI